MKSLYKRTLSGFIFLLAVVGCLLRPQIYVIAMAALILLLSSEFYSMTAADRKFAKEKFAIGAAGILLFVLGYFCRAHGMASKWLFTAFIPLIAALLFMLRDCARDYDFNTALFFPLIYIALPVCSTLFLAVDSQGAYSPKLLLGLLALIWMNDIGAYALGMSLGQKPTSRKLAPKLSPKKSWWGIIGGTLFTLLSAWAVSSLLFPDVLSAIHWFALALIVSVFGVCGDLFESLIKRHAQVKDAGNLIPGHGGLLDRFDDVLFVMPLAAVYLSLLSLI